jgi:hypothetical protein
LSDPSSYSFLSLEIKFKVFFSIVIIFFKKIINDNDNNKNNTNDYKLGSDDPARPKFLGSGSPNNNNNIIIIIIKLIRPKFL